MHLHPVLRRKSYLLWVYLLLQCALHGTAFLLFHNYHQTLNIPESFKIQIYYCFPVLAAVSIIIVLRTKQMITAGFILFALFISLVVGYPLNDHIAIELLLYISVSFSSLILLQSPWNIVISSFTILSALFFQKHSLSWGREITPPDALQFIIIAVSLISSSLLFYTVSRLNRIRLLKDQDIEQMENTIKRLTLANIGFQDYTRYIEEQSRAKERNRITRELHDVVGYTLTNIAMMMEEGIDVYKQKDMQKLLSLVVETRDQARNGHSEIREALKKLRTIEAAENHFLKSIDKMIKTFTYATKLDVSVEYTNFPPKIDHGIGSCILRLIQEGMTNAVRHGKASFARVVLGRDREDLVVSVSDDGVGCIDLQEGLGITGMRERLRFYGGSITFSNNSDGFQFIARLPMNGITIN